MGENKYKLSLHHMTGGLLGKMSVHHPDYGKGDGPRTIDKPSTGLKKLPPHLQKRIHHKRRKKKSRKSSPNGRNSQSPERESNVQGRSSLMNGYRKNKLKKKAEEASLSEQAGAKKKMLKRKRRKMKKFSVT